MEKINFNLDRLKVKGRKLTKNQELSNQIFNWSNKKLSFGMLMAMIKRKGYQRVYTAWANAKDSKSDYPHKVFMINLRK